MSSSRNNVLLIENPLNFMTKSYFEKNFLINDFFNSKNIIEIAYKNNLPKKILITFASPEKSDQFLSQYNNKSFDPFISYKLKISKTSKTLKDLEKEISEEKAKNNETELENFVFKKKYEDEYKTEYVLSNEKEGLLYINQEEMDRIYKTVKYLVSKFGQNLLQGKSILSISFPVFIFDTRTLHEVFAFEHRYTPLYLTRAYYANNNDKDHLERLKWVTVFLLSMVHLTTIQIKPFNPIIGETFQTKIGDFNLYLEHTVNHPITANFYGFDDMHRYEIFGYQITDASVSPNAVTATRLGRYMIQFSDDGAKYMLKIPTAYLQGITMNDRLYNYIDKGLVMDLTHGLVSYIEFNPPEESGGFFGFFSSGKKNMPDYFRGDIVSKKYVQVDETGGKHELKSGYKSLCKIEGEWTSQIMFDKKVYWDIDDDEPVKMKHCKFVLPSDGTFRPDREWLIKGDEERSQKEKENLEVLQRADRKLRKEYAEKNKK